MALRWILGLILAVNMSGGPLTGAWIREVPPQEQGVLVLGDRVLQPGDVLTAQQVANMEFRPGCTEEAQEVFVQILPITADGMGEEVVLTFRTKENQPPQARDGTMETYKNLPNTGRLPVTDPEGQAMTYTLARSPRRGTVELHADGSFTYTPKENKVGIDSFVFTATDAAGGVSRQATVTVTILKPTESALYTDTMGQSCQFAAEWMKNTGIFRGETLGNAFCFQPGKEVTQGEFLVMLVKTLDIPVEEDLDLAGFSDAPGWLRPYLAAALRAGVTGIDADAPLTAGAAAAMLESATGYTPAFAQDSEVLTRGDVAILLYRLHRLDYA